ncbi:MAG: exodeoxyribonuclease VII large subunit, partial [Bacilli bacterium]
HYTDMKLVNYNGRIQNIYSNLLQLRRHNLNLISSKLASLNPNQVLKRGYALVERDGIVIDSSKLIEVNDALDISWFDGKVRTKVTHKEESNHGK